MDFRFKCGYVRKIDTPYGRGTGQKTRTVRDQKPFYGHLANAN